MALIGYVRQSIGGQSADDQSAALKAVGCERLYVDLTARQEAPRGQLAEALEAAAAGDLIVVTRADRPAKSIADLHDIVRRLTAKGAGFRCLEQPAIDTSIGAEPGLVPLLDGLAELEFDIRAERRRDGIETAKEKGIYRGRKPSVDAEAIRTALAAGERPASVARRLKVARSTVYRLAG